jgi:putative ABC transport system ATP-binding protein
MSAPLFNIRDLAKVYHMGEVQVHALRQVNLQLDEGKFVVLLGPSGSGKSTLLNIIGGLDVPTSGEVFYRDTSLTHADETALTTYRREHVGFVFQFYNLIPSLTAVENVALVTEISESPMNPADALQLVNLGERPGPLSRAAVRRRAATRRDCPRDRQAPRRPALRRADRRARHLDWRRRARGAGTRERGDGHDHRGHHAQRAIASMADRVIRLADGRVVSVEDSNGKSLTAGSELVT